MNDLSQLHIENLPEKPWCADTFDYGIEVMPREIAKRKKYIQHNHPAWLTCLVFDVDKRAYEILEEINAKPNLAVFNRKKRGSAHFIYRLTTPVNTGKNGRMKPIKFVKNLTDALTVQLQADPNYTGLLSKNPTHPDHYTITSNLNTWSLNHLADFVDFKQKKPERAISEHSRHLILFDRVRLYAYEIVEEYRETGAFEVFTRTLTCYAEDKNTFDNLPSLPYSSIKAIVKSVSNWTWKNYDSKYGCNRGRDKHDNQFLKTPTEKRILSAIRTNQNQKKATQEKILSSVRRLQGSNKKITQKAIQEDSGLGIATIKRHWKEVKNLVNF